MEGLITMRQEGVIFEVGRGDGMVLYFECSGGHRLYILVKL